MIIVNKVTKVESKMCVI